MRADFFADRLSSVNMTLRALLCRVLALRIAGCCCDVAFRFLLPAV
jgi:hypothetical protein